MTRIPCAPAFRESRIRRQRLQAFRFAPPFLAKRSPRRPSRPAAAERTELAVGTDQAQFHFPSTCPPSRIFYNRRTYGGSGQRISGHSTDEQARALLGR